MFKKQLQANVAVEAIQHQGKSSLFTKISTILTEVRESGDLSAEAFNTAGLAAAIFDESGISVKIIVDQSTAFNAAVEVPQIDKNNPIIAQLQRMMHTNNDLAKVIKFTGNKLIGIVDKKESRLYGGFSKLLCPLYLTVGILSSDKFTSDELAAVILHELGHVFTYFEHLIDLTSSTYAISAAADKMLKLETNVDRIEVLSDFEKVTNLSLKDKETIANSTDKGTVYTHLSCEALKQRRNQEGNEVYAYRGFEFSSDQFAARHGAGYALVSAMIKVDRAIWLNPSYISWPLHIAIQLAKTLYIVAALAFSIAAVAPINVIAIGVLLLSARPMDKLYDDPEARLTRIVNEMKAELKNTQLTDMRRKQVVEDVYQAKKLMEPVADKATVLEAIWHYILPGGNETHKHTTFQQELEALAHNDLYLASALFK